MRDKMERQKGTITHFGFIVDGKPKNWGFDCMGAVPVLGITADGEMLYAGYSVLELEQLSRDFWSTKSD